MGKGSKHLTALLFFLFCFASLLPAYSQKLNLRKFSVKDGLPQSTVKKIIQDDYGNLWLATHYGLSRFNGKKFTNFTTQDGLMDNDVNALCYYDGKIFIGTRKGLCFFDGSKRILSSPYTQRIKGDVRKILVHDNELHIFTSRNYYILESDSGLVSLDSIAMPNIITKQVNDAQFDADGNLWIATQHKGLYFIEFTTSLRIPKLTLIQYSAASLTYKSNLLRVANFSHDNILKGNYMMCLEFDHQGNLWLNDWENGLAKLSFEDAINSTFKIEYYGNEGVYKKLMRCNRIYEINCDRNGALWLATDGFGIVKLSPDEYTQSYVIDSLHVDHYTKGNGMYGNNPMCFYSDNDQNLWIGTLYDGLILMNTYSTLSYDKQSGLEEEKVTSLYKPRSGSSIWLGTYGGGAFQFVGNTFNRCFWENGISESIINSVTEDSYSNIWLSTYGGGISIVGNPANNPKLKVVKVLEELKELRSNYVTFLKTTSDSSIWVGYKEGSFITRLRSDKQLNVHHINYYIDRGLKGPVNCLFEDSDKNIWVGAADGLWRLNPANGDVELEYASYKNIHTLSEDWLGNLWVGTSDAGIVILKNRVKSKYFERATGSLAERIDTEKGLSSNCVNTLLKDGNGYWVITNNGLNRISVNKELNYITDVKTYSKDRGFASYDNYPNAAFLDDDNSIWIGSVEGLFRYNNLSKDNGDKNRALRIILSKMMVDQKEIDWSSPALFKSGELASISFDGYYNWFKLPMNPELDYTHNTVTFECFTNSIGDQDRVSYEYKLSGFDKDWNQATFSNIIHYSNLPPGRYTLLIRASLSTDFSMSKEEAFSFVINPPFWRTTSFYLITGGILVGVIFFFIQRRESKLKRDKFKLELQVRARTAEIEKTKREIEIQNSVIKGINDDLTDSIKYAKRIQQALLPNLTAVNHYFSESFVYYDPRDIVSGDYYWMEEKNGLMYIAVVDCTGHGVPGAFLSLISSNILTESLNVLGYNPSTASILSYLKKEIYLKLHQNNGEADIKDGLDIALIRFDPKSRTIEFANANRPLYIISDDTLETLKPSKISISGYQDGNEGFPSVTKTVKPGDFLILFTDGITDQFGGEKDKKYNPSRFRQFLLLHNHLALPAINLKLQKEMTQWRGASDQTDDILVVGLRV